MKVVRALECHIEKDFFSPSVKPFFKTRVSSRLEFAKCAISVSSNTSEVSDRRYEVMNDGTRFLTFGNTPRDKSKFKRKLRCAPNAGFEFMLCRNEFFDVKVTAQM